MNNVITEPRCVGGGIMENTFLLWIQPEFRHRCFIGFRLKFYGTKARSCLSTFPVALPYDCCPDVYSLIHKINTLPVQRNKFRSPKARPEGKLNQVTALATELGQYPVDFVSGKRLWLFCFWRKVTEAVHRVLVDQAAIACILNRLR